MRTIWTLTGRSGNLWQASFAWNIIILIFIVWIAIMAFQVNSDDYE